MTFQLIQSGSTVEYMLMAVAAAKHTNATAYTTALVIVIDEALVLSLIVNYLHKVEN
jgi:hypothetical protein